MWDLFVDEGKRGGEEEQRLRRWMRRLVERLEGEGGPVAVADVGTSEEVRDGQSPVGGR
jgi:hypothetical protein